MNKQEFINYIEEIGTAYLKGISSLTDVTLIGKMKHLDDEGTIVKQQFSFNQPIHKVLDLAEDICEDDFQLFVTYEAKNDGEQVYSFFGTVKIEDDTMQFPIIMTYEEVEIFENLIDKAFLKDYKSTFETHWKNNKIFKLANVIEREYDQFISQLKTKPVDEIVNCSYEKVFKNEIYAYFVDVDATYISDSLTSEQILFLLSLKNPLEFLYQNWCNEEESYMENLECSMFGFDVHPDGYYKFGHFNFHIPAISIKDFILNVKEKKIVTPNVPVDVSFINYDISGRIELDDNLHLKVPVRLRENPYDLFNIGYSLEEDSNFKYFVDYDAKQDKYLLFCSITDNNGVVSASFQLGLSKDEISVIDNTLNTVLDYGCREIWKMEMIKNICPTMNVELDNFRDRLKHKEPEELIRLSYEMVFKEQICKIFSDEQSISFDFDVDRLFYLQKKANPLDFLYESWTNGSGSISSPVLDVLCNFKVA